MKDEKTVVPETIFEKPDMKEEQLEFSIPLDKLVANVIAKKDARIAELEQELSSGRIAELETSLLYASGQLSGYGDNVTKHPQEVYEEMIRYGRNPTNKPSEVNETCDNLKRMKVFVAQTFDIAMHSEGQCACEKLRSHCYNDNLDLEDLVKDV